MMATEWKTPFGYKQYSSSVHPGLGFRDASHPLCGAQWGLHIGGKTVIRCDNTHALTPFFSILLLCQHESKLKIEPCRCSSVFHDMQKKKEKKKPEQQKKRRAEMCNYKAER